MVKRNRGLSALCIGCTLLMTNSSWAAIVEPGLGDLTINQGHGFKPVTGRVKAMVGDSVMVGPGGAATLVYDDGCKVDVRPGAVTTIAVLSPCASGSNAAVEDSRRWCYADPNHPEQYTNCGWTGWDWFFGALAVGTGVFIGIEASHQNQKGASP